MTLRIQVDMDLCQGHGVCCSEAPDLFELGSEKVRALREVVPSEQDAAARAAAKYCPTGAISLEEE